MSVETETKTETKTAKTTTTTTINSYLEKTLDFTTIGTEANTINKTSDTVKYKNRLEKKHTKNKKKKKKDLFLC